MYSSVGRLTGSTSTSAPSTDPSLMALEIGSRLGHHDVAALIGEGDMGEGTDLPTT